MEFRINILIGIIQKFLAVDNCPLGHILPSILSLQMKNVLVGF